MTSETISSVQTNSRVLPKPFVLASILLGMALAGFFDGIFLHQILQWHHMLSSVQPLTSLSDLKTHSIADGLFHALDYGLAIAGVTVLWRAHLQDQLPKATQPFVGLILVGAGLFNTIEGLIDHEILGIHHVRSGAYYMLWDIGFLVLGISLIAIGALLTERWKNAQKTAS